LPGLFSFKCGASVWFNDYNKDVLNEITIPNILVNCNTEENNQKTRFFSGDWESLRSKYLSSEIKAESDKFDVVSIQFAIHYMMSTRKRARRFFHTVSSLLEVGGNLIATTIDARVVVEKLMGLGLDYHFDHLDTHSEVDKSENEERHHNGNRRRKVSDEEGATVSVGQGVCRLKFDADTLQKVFQPPKSPEDMFGLQYTFTLVEGSDHAAGVGEAVDLPEWLTPIPALQELAEESGLKLEYATNFHKFYEERKNPASFPMAHNALYNMKVLNRNGSISEQEWEVSRMYIALKFRKVKESSIELGDDDIGEDER